MTDKDKKEIPFPRIPEDLLKAKPTLPRGLR